MNVLFCTTGILSFFLHSKSYPTFPIPFSCRPPGPLLNYIFFFLSLVKGRNPRRGEGLEFGIFPFPQRGMRRSRRGFGYNQLMTLRLISWNLAGMRAAVKKAFWDFVKRDSADIYCFQEVKALPDQVPLLECPSGYHQFWNPAKKAGYSGVATFTKEEPKSVIIGEADNDWDDEGRVIVTKFDEFTLLNVYIPNGGRDLGRLDYKMKFYDAFLKYINKLRDRERKLSLAAILIPPTLKLISPVPKITLKIPAFSLSSGPLWISLKNRVGLTPIVC